MECLTSTLELFADDRKSTKISVSVIIPVRDEEENLGRCLGALQNMSEVYVVDSGSTDATVEVARDYGAKVVQFRYSGGWPKKRQWAMENLSFANDWILLVDADEVVTPELEREIQVAVANPDLTGYRIRLQMRFMGRCLRHAGATFEKLCLFRKGDGEFECRVEEQDGSMCDMEVHEHMMVRGKTATLRQSLRHENVSDLSRYISKHNEYSNWEAAVWKRGKSDLSLKPAFFGTQAQRRRWLREKFFWMPGSSLFFFLYRYILKMGFLDGTPGLIYCGMQGIQFFHIKAKIFELRRTAVSNRPAC
jgi:glycosyltransferase involved in cell wall biosynthesis